MREKNVWRENHLYQPFFQIFSTTNNDSCLQVRHTYMHLTHYFLYYIGIVKTNKYTNDKKKQQQET